MENLSEILQLDAGHDLNVIAAHVLQGDDLTLRPSDTFALENAMESTYRFVDGYRKFGLGFDRQNYKDVAFVLDYPPRNEWGNDPSSERLVWFAYLERDGKPYAEALTRYFATFRREPPRFSNSSEGAECVIEMLRERGWVNHLIDNRADFSPDALRQWRERPREKGCDAGRTPVLCYFAHRGLPERNQVAGFAHTRPLAIVRGGIQAALAQQAQQEKDNP